MREKGFAPIIIILLIAAIGVAFYFGTKVSKVPFVPAVIPSPTSSEVPKIESKTSVDPVTGQNLYTNISQGFSFEYPDNFYVSNLNPPHNPQTFISAKDTGDPLDRRYMSITSNYLQFLENDQPKKDIAMKLVELGVGESYTYESAVNYFETATRVADQNIGGVKALVFDIPKVWEGDGPYREILVPQGSDYMLIFYSNSNYKEHAIDYLSGFKQILSTFKFTK